MWRERERGGSAGQDDRTQAKVPFAALACLVILPISERMSENGRKRQKTSINAFGDTYYQNYSSESPELLTCAPRAAHPAFFCLLDLFAERGSRAARGIEGFVPIDGLGGDAAESPLGRGSRRLPCERRFNGRRQIRAPRGAGRRRSIPSRASERSMGARHVCASERGGILFGHSQWRRERMRSGRTSAVQVRGLRKDVERRRSPRVTRTKLCVRGG